MIEMEKVNVRCIVDDVDAAIQTGKSTRRPASLSFLRAICSFCSTDRAPAAPGDRWMMAEFRRPAGSAASKSRSMICPPLLPS